MSAKDAMGAQEAARPTIDGLFIHPPLAIARVGGADTPLEAFVWATDQRANAGNRTIVEPAATLTVQDDGTVSAHMPKSIQFRDGRQLRPVAPFFEIWVQESGKAAPEPLTLAVLERHGLSLDNIQYSITVANRKAERRTHDAACAFIAQVDVPGDDHQMKPLRAFSPRNASEQPLVSPERPIHLGSFQVVKPAVGIDEGIDLSVVRCRFTPARGEVYGPPEADAGPASSLPQGDTSPVITKRGRLYEIVPAENRILNAGTSWSSYVMNVKGQMDPQPSDSYDGADIGTNKSWGVVDDTCDGVIQVQLVVHGERKVAHARVLACNPDYAPDRRPFYSVADDLADRDLDTQSWDADSSEFDQTLDEVGDLFQRIYETMSLMNLDAVRFHGIDTNPDPGRLPTDHGPLPRIDERSMTREDRLPDSDTPFAGQDRLQEFAPGKESDEHDGRLPYVREAHRRHAPFNDLDSLIQFLSTRENLEIVDRLIRPPWGRFANLPPDPAETPDPRFRDPRLPRDLVNDMRMPPYMRDSDENSLSLTWRQYTQIRAVLEAFREQKSEAHAAGPHKRSRVAREMERLRARAQEAKRDGRPRPVGAQVLGEAPTHARATQRKIFPRNLTAQMDDLVAGNPVSTRLEDAVGNCYPGLEMDVRNLDRRFFPGLVFEFVARDDVDSEYSEPDRYGAYLLYVDTHDPALTVPAESQDQRDLQDSLASELGDIDPDAPGDLYLDWIKQGGTTISMLWNRTDPTPADPSRRQPEKTPMDGLYVWRIIRGLRPGPLTIGLRSRGDGGQTVELHGWRRRFTDEKTGVISLAYQPGELLQSLCSPWQHDFRDCACHYWPANHPDAVFPRETSPEADAAGDESRRVDWLRRERRPGLAARASNTALKDRPFQLDHFEVSRRWQDFDMVLEETEVDSVYVPPGADDAEPFSSPDEMIDMLSGKLAPLECTLAIQYLYATFSVDPADPSEEAMFTRGHLFDVAVSEMVHLRMVNELLWELARITGKPYKPAVEPLALVPRPAPHISMTARRSRRHSLADLDTMRDGWLTAPLRPIDAEACRSFIAIEDPGGYIDLTYTRVVATLRRGGYPPRLASLATRITSDGLDHYQRFRSLKALFDFYKAPPRWVRPLVPGPESNSHVKKALEAFATVKGHLIRSFTLAAADDKAGATVAKEAARRAMDELHTEALAAAADNLGVPFWRTEDK
jgi:hypothetical protein